MNKLDQKFLNSFGETLKQLRENKKLSQEKLANLAGLHPTYISQVERGKRNLSLITLRKICSALGYPLSNFFKTMER